MCVLLIENDDTIRTMVADELREHGFPVREARDGAVARSYFNLEPDWFAVIVTDHGLSKNATGIEIAAEIRELRPDLPVIIMSGRVEQVAPEFRLPPWWFVLSKPLRLADLTALVHHVTRTAMDRPLKGAGA